MKKMLSVILFCACATAFAESGKIKICRHPGLTEMMDKKRILIPAKSSFTNSGPNNDFVVTTISDVTLGAKPGCAIAAANITENQGNKTVTRRNGRLVAQFMIEGATLDAFVVENFK